ncbi:ExeM/NucH family extracellular endonuclease [Thermus tengchongensis]|uniref:ExeM/NucH family extracellular endonuclease n=1 Tax=Thermus tengchongensis TaxID=1214928 RepID=UPI001F168B53|nr:ExeM/NucH family extracellular endonuclease [Thermus tengchongensis]
MRARWLGLLAVASLLGACTGQRPQAGETAVRVLNAPETVQVVTLEVNGTPQAVAKEGEVWTARVRLGPGEHTFVARGLDAPGGVVLYKAHERKRVTPGQEVRLRLFRLTSDVQVEVENPAPGESYLAKAGGAMAALPGGQGTLQGVPTGRGVALLVEARSPSGMLLRQGSASFDLSEAPLAVRVSLQAVAHQPPQVELQGASQVEKGQAYALRVVAQDPNPEDRGVALTRLVVEWGDGARSELALSGRQAVQELAHTYTAAGAYTLTVRVENSAGLAAQESLTLEVLEPETPIVIEPGPDLARVELAVSGAPEGTSSLVAEITPETPLVPQSLRPLDLRNRYQVPLFPQGDLWRGALHLPQGLGYRLVLVAQAGGQEVRSREEAFRTQGAEVRVELPFVPAPEYACPAPAAPLKATYEVQGRGDRSPLVGQTVAVRGVVTAVFPGLQGYFIQDPRGDGDPETSDGLFVYAASSSLSVAVGQYVQVVGPVSEYAASGDTLGTLTQVRQNSVQVCGEMALPQAVTLTLPVADLERYEGMRVRVEGLTVTEVYDLGRYGQVTLAPFRLPHPNADGDPATQVDPSRPLYSGYTLVLDDGSTAQNPNPIPYLTPGGTLRVGDRLLQAEGILEWRFGAYRLQPTQEPPFATANPRPPAPSLGEGLKVASFNLHNWFTTFSGTFTPPGCAASHQPRGAKSAQEWERQKAKLVAALSALDADVVALQEVQNNGAEALEALVQALNERLGPGTYAYVPDPQGGLGCDAIKVGLLYKPSRVERVGEPLALASATFERYPLAQAFRDKATGGVFTAVSVHLKSKGSCDASDPDTGQGCWNGRRTAQARELADWVEGTLKAMDPDVLVLGDFNAYEEEDPLVLLRDRGLSPLLRGHYTYVFQGLTGALDHAYATPSLTAQVRGALVWHINADEPRVLDYTLAYKADDRYAPDPYRSSDHDPLLLALALTADAPPSGGGPGTGGATCAPEGAPVVINEFRFRGPSGGNDEFIELFNRSCTPVDLTGWKLQGWSGTSWGDRAILASVTLEPGQYYLLANTASGGYSLSVPPDQTYTTGIGDNRAVRLLDAQGRVVDLVGFAASGQFEGAGIPDGPTANPPGQISWKRLPSGKDTDNNAQDFFFGENWANPQNRQSPFYGDN